MSPKIAAEPALAPTMPPASAPPSPPVLAHASALALPAADVRRTAITDAGLLAEIAAGLSTDSDMRALLQRFLEPIVQLAGASAGAVRVLSEAGDQLVMLGSIGLPGAASGAEGAVDRHCGYCGQATDTQSLVWAADIDDCSRRVGAGFFGSGCRRMLAVPLQHRGRVQGVYNLFYPEGAEPTAEIRGVLKTIGELIGLAMNNAALEAETLRARLMHERQTMAAEVHDSIAQTLTFVKMRLPLLQDALHAHDDARATRYLGDVREAIVEAHQKMREIVAHLRTRIDPRGLDSALLGLAARFRQRSGIELIYRNAAAGLKLPAEAETDVFHIAQEALANIEKHSAARHTWFTFDTAPGGYEIRIEDDGVGPAVSDEQTDDGSHFGLGIMSERAQRLGGRLTVAPRPAGGTRVRLAFPAASPVETRQ